MHEVKMRSTQCFYLPLSDVGSLHGCPNNAVLAVLDHDYLRREMGETVVKGGGNIRQRQHQWG